VSVTVLGQAGRRRRARRPRVVAVPPPIEGDDLAIAIECSAVGGDLKPVPTHPTHCRGCGVELERLRRWGGYCRACVRGLPHKARSHAEWSIVRVFTRKRGPNGRISERMVRIRCTCGKERVISWSEWTRRRTNCCKRCSLAGFDAGMMGLP